MLSNNGLASLRGRIHRFKLRGVLTVKHHAIIPARMGSKGLPFKNRYLFDETACFLDQVSWIDHVLVSTNDPVIKNYANQRNYEIHHRSEDLSLDDVSIKQVFEDIISCMNFSSHDVLWLFYLPIVYKNAKDFNDAKAFIESNETQSLCSFIRAKTHPLNCWQFDSDSQSLNQYIANDVFRRQDLPDAWMHYHYLCCFKTPIIHSLNSELIYEKTKPIFLSQETTKQLYEIDTKDEYHHWMNKTVNST